MKDTVESSPGASRREFLGVLSASAVAPFGFRQPGFEGRQPGQTRDVLDMPFRWCPPGAFVMGSPLDEPGRRGDEAQVRVTLSRGFWMARTEVTQSQWRRIVGAWPDRAPSADFGLGDAFGMYWVNYAEAESFCARVTEAARKSGALPAGWTVRLPTEAQWEYACRAGTTTAFAFGSSLSRAQANLLGESPGPGQPVPAGRGEPVGSYLPNPWGLCDMHGNLFEWCRDWYHTTLPGGTDPLMTQRGQPNRDGSYSRVRRGGAWNDEPQFCRSALRLRYEPERRSDHIGFRVAIVSD